MLSRSMRNRPPGCTFTTAQTGAGRCGRRLPIVDPLPPCALTHRILSVLYPQEDGMPVPSRSCEHDPSLQVTQNLSFFYFKVIPPFYFEGTSLCFSTGGLIFPPQLKTTSPPGPGASPGRVSRMAVFWDNVRRLCARKACSFTWVRRITFPACVDPFVKPSACLEEPLPGRSYFFMSSIFLPSPPSNPH